MKFSRIKMGLAALAIVLFAGFAIAQHHERSHGGEFFGEHALGFFTDYLDLTSAQQGQIKQIIAKEKPAMEPLFKQEMQSHEQMLQLIQSGSFDEAKAQTIATQGAQVHAQLEVQHARIISEAYQILTAEQKTKLAQFLAKREQRFERHMQEHESGTNPEDGPNR